MSKLWRLWVLGLGSAWTAVDVGPILQRLARPTVLQIGACDGDYELSNDPVQRFLMETKAAQGLLVEPSPRSYDLLVERLRAFPQLTALNVAVAPAAQGSVLFYVVAERFGRDHPRKAFHWAMLQLNSMDREHVGKRSSSF